MPLTSKARHHSARGGACDTIVAEFRGGAAENTLLVHEDAARGSGIALLPAPNGAAQSFGGLLLEQHQQQTGLGHGLAGPFTNMSIS